MFRALWAVIKAIENKTIFGCGRGWQSRRLREKRDEEQARGRKERKEVYQRRLLSPLWLRGWRESFKHLRSAGPQEGQRCLSLKEEVEVRRVMVNNID